VVILALLLVFGFVGYGFGGCVFQIFGGLFSDLFDGGFFRLFSRFFSGFFYGLFGGVLGEFFGRLFLWFFDVGLLGVGLLVSLCHVRLLGVTLLFLGLVGLRFLDMLITVFLINRQFAGFLNWFLHSLRNWLLYWLFGLLRRFLHSRLFCILLNFLR